MNNCDPFTASVLVAETTPAATLVIWRSEPSTPTDTTEVGAVAATVPPLRENTPAFGAVVTEPAPSATSLALVAVAPLPSETPLAASDAAKGPMATLSVPVAVLSAKAELALKYLLFAPPLASAPSAEPTSVYLVPAMA